MKTNPHGAAFPRPASEYTANGTLPDGNDAVREQEGMSIREHYAGLAMQGLCADPETADMSFDQTADSAVKYADALLARLNK